MKKVLILAILAATFMFTACGDGPDNSKPTPGMLTAFAVIGEDHDFPLINETCWDWYPEGDGVFWALSNGTSGQALRFPFRKVTKGKALIEELGEVKTGDVVYVRYINGIQPIFKIIEIDPARGGVRVAPTGVITGSCKSAGHTA